MADEVQPAPAAQELVTSAPSVLYDKGPFEHFAFVIGYCGTAFRGLQLQAHTYTHHTVEGTIIQSMRDAGLVRCIERGKIADFANGFFRSCRTDKGVHAVRNVLSWTVTLPYLRHWLRTSHGVAESERLDWATVSDLLAASVNAKLPGAIRVLSVVKVTRQFHPKDSCFRRIYRYLIPLYAVFGKMDGWTSLGKTLPDLLVAMTSASPPLSTGLHDLETFEQTEWGKLLSSAVSKANDVLFAYLGSRRYHNFCGGGAGDDRVSSRATISPLSDEAVRTIYRCEVSSKVLLLDPAQTGATASWLGACPAAGGGWTRYPYVVFQVEGASFLLNMIRKMVGILLAVLNGARGGLLEEALSPGKRVAVPMAPAQHLTLVNSFYTHYDASVPSAFTPLATVMSVKALQRANTFLEDAIYTDIVDTDLNRTPILDALLQVRNDQMTEQQKQDDLHLASMKEFIPHVCPDIIVPAVSPMTAFLRSLRVHNWSMKDVSVPEGSKAANGERNRQAFVVPVKRPRGEDLEEDDARDTATGKAAAVRPVAAEDGWVVSSVSAGRECLTRRRYAAEFGKTPTTGSGDE